RRPCRKVLGFATAQPHPTRYDTHLGNPFSRNCSTAERHKPNRPVWCVTRRYRQSNHIPVRQVLRKATAYLRKNRIVICPISDTTDGVGIVSLPIFDIDVNDLSGLGQATLAALEHSKKQVRHPALNEWNELFDPVLKAAGDKSWNTFSRSAKNVPIRFETNRVVFVQTNSSGPRDGFS